MKMSNPFPLYLNEILEFSFTTSYLKNLEHLRLERLVDCMDEDEKSLLYSILLNILLHTIFVSVFIHFKSHIGKIYNINLHGENVKNVLKLFGQKVRETEFLVYMKIVSILFWESLVPNLEK